MRRYIFRAALTLCFLLLFTGVKAQQQLVVKFSNGADSKAFNLADIKKPISKSWKPRMCMNMLIMQLPK